MRKTKTITLAWFIGAEYQVIRITDSTEFHPGQYLKETEVNRLCESLNWKVTITRPEK